MSDESNKLCCTREVRTVGELRRALDQYPSDVALNGKYRVAAKYSPNGEPGRPHLCTIDSVVI